MSSAEVRRPSMRGYPDPSLRVAPIRDLDLAGRRIAVVGGTDGLGRALARLAAERGAEVVVVGRTERDAGVPRIRFERADLSSMKEAVRVGGVLAAQDLDTVVFTTGIMAATQREATAEGVERDLAVSYLSRFALARELVPRLKAAPGGDAPRVFVMGFPGAGNAGDPGDLNADRSYAAFPVHMNTVAANEALVLDLAARHPGVGVFGLNPGLVKTGIRANYLGEGSLTHRVSEFLIGLFTPSPERYAGRILPLLAAPELEGRSGAMFGSAGTAILPTPQLTPERVRAFHDASQALLERALAT